MLRFIYCYWNVYAHDPHPRRAMFASRTHNWTMYRLPWQSIRHWSSNDVVHHRLPNRRCVNWASERVVMYEPIHHHRVHMYRHHFVKMLSKSRQDAAAMAKIFANRLPHRRWHCITFANRLHHRRWHCIRRAAKIVAIISVDRPLIWDCHGIESSVIAVRRTDSMEVWSVAERTVVCCHATAVWRQWEHIAHHRIVCCRLASTNASWNRALKTVVGYCNRYEWPLASHAITKSFFLFQFNHLIQRQRPWPIRVECKAAHRRLWNWERRHRNSSTWLYHRHQCRLHFVCSPPPTVSIRNRIFQISRDVSTCRPKRQNCLIHCNRVHCQSIQRWDMVDRFHIAIKNWIPI